MNQPWVGCTFVVAELSMVLILSDAMITVFATGLELLQLHL